MTIETKYHIGDEVWCSFAGETMLCRITNITPVEMHDAIYIVYSIEEKNGIVCGTRLGSELFLTKEE